MRPACLHNTCRACGKSGGKLLRCGRCNAAWFCSHDRQVLAVKQGHQGANCLPEGVQRTASSANPESTTIMVEALSRYQDLMAAARNATKANTRVGWIAASENYEKAAKVIKLIDGANAALLVAEASMQLSSCCLHSGDTASAVRAASQRVGLRLKRAAGRLS